MKIKKFGTIRHEGKNVIIENFVWGAESIGDYFLSDYQRCKIICDFILDNCEPVESIVDFSAERIVADAIRKARGAHRG